MVAIKNQNHRFSPQTSFESHHRSRNLHRIIVCTIAGLFIFWILVVFNLLQQTGAGALPPQKPSSSSSSDRVQGSAAGGNHNLQKNTTASTTASTIRGSRNYRLTCPSSRMSISKDLTDEQRNPTVGKRWMVRPPSGGNLHLMCCDTTKGSFHVLLHEQWAPIGVSHLLGMLHGRYFETDIPLFRCTDACQFGLSSNATLTKQFRKSIPDDPLWLPTGPEHRFSSGKEKIKRYPKGVLTHAGGGKNSRGVQFVLTLKPNKFMGGGSPWEVPLGEVVEALGESGNSHEEREFVDVSLPDIYTGYGEKGPGQGLLGRKGADESVREQWPLLDYVLGCSLIDQLFVDEGAPKDS